MARENRPPRRQEENDGLIKKTIEINRVSKTVKGGKNMRFAALRSEEHTSELQSRI